MKNNYYIIGSGGFAKEVYSLADEVLGDSHTFLGFIDYNPQINQIKVRGRSVPVIDENYFLTNIVPSETVSVFFGVGDPKLIRRLSNLFHNYKFPNLIHKTFIGDIASIQFGQGNIVTAGCIFTVDINIGSFNVFNLGTTVGHDVIIEDCNIFNPGCNVSGDVTIGSSNLFGTNNQGCRSSKSY